MIGCAMVVNGAARIARVALRQRVSGAMLMRTEGMLLCRSMSSAKNIGKPSGIEGSNPFEIQFHTDDATKVVGSKPGAQASTTFDDEIDLFHAEMESVFGSETEEFRDDGNNQSSSSLTSASDKEVSDATIAASSPNIAHLYPSRPPTATTAPYTRSRPSASHRQPSVQREIISSSVMLINGPCTFVQGSWIGAPELRLTDDFQNIVANIGQVKGVAIAQYHSNHEGDILDLLLNSSPGAKIIVNWNGRLSDSPAVYRALSSIQAFVVIMTPLDVEIGPLPSTVKGVITGFGARSLELAIEACA